MATMEKFIALKTYLQEMIDNGYLASDWTPLKCPYCDSKNLRDENFYEDCYLVETERYCKDCGKLVGLWSYGHWRL